MTAVDRVDEERIDHQGYVPEIFAGLLLTALYLLQIGPSIPNLNDRLEDWLALSLFTGSVLGLVGVVLGTKWVFRKINRRVSYIIESIGVPMLIFSLGVYTYASVDTHQLLLTAMSGGLGLTIEIGCVRLLVDLINELHEEREFEDD